MRPLARRRGLILRELPAELVVYDTRDHRAHCLNRTAAQVFREADGSRGVAELAAGLAGGGSAATREAAVALALRQLAAAGLLADGAPASPAAPPAEAAGRRRTRRECLRAAGAAALILPAVATVIAPTPAQAATCELGCTTAGGDPKPEGTPCRCTSDPNEICGTCELGACNNGGGC